MLSTSSSPGPESRSGVQFIIGYPQRGGGRIQSVLFDKKKWTGSQAVAWLNRHEFKYRDLDETEERLRFRQEEPRGFVRFRTINAGGAMKRNPWDEDQIEEQDEQDEQDEPEEGDITSSDDKHWYQYGKLYHTGDRRSLKKKMDRDQFWPNVWTISDHGNAILISVGRGWWRDRDMSQNPRSEVDPAAVRELALFINNDGDLYRQQHIPIIKNLLWKMRKGIFDKEKAVKLFMSLTEAGAKKYGRDFSGGPGIPSFFNKATREAAARELLDEFVTEKELGNYDSLDLRIGHNPQPPYDPGFTTERPGVERASWDKDFLAPTGSTGHTYGTAPSSPDDRLGPKTAGERPPGDAQGPEPMTLKNPHERQTPPTGSFSTEDLSSGFDLPTAESYGHEGRAGGKEPLPAEARLNPDTLRTGQEPDPAPRLNPLIVAGEDTMGASGQAPELDGGKGLPAPEGSDYGGSKLLDKDGAMPRLNPESGDLVYVGSHAQADALDIPAGPDRGWRDSQTSAVVHRKTGEIWGYTSGHTFSHNARVRHPLSPYVDAAGRYGLNDYPIYAASDEAAKLVRDAKYTVKFRLVRLETTRHQVKGNPMTLGSEGRVHGASSFVLETAGSPRRDEGTGAPQLNPQRVLRCPSCNKRIRGNPEPGAYTCAGCGAAVQVGQRSNPPGKPFATIAEVEAANKAHGGHFFDRQTMRFFKSRIESSVLSGRYFLTSEQPPGGRRAYTVRRASDTGAVRTVGELGAYATKEQARKAAYAAAEEDPEA